jgi:hypothetical protein
MHKLLILTIPLLCLFCRCANDLPAEPIPPGYWPAVADAYVYPEGVTATVTSGEELRDAYQLPADVLESISTAGLIRSFLDYPLLISYGLSSALSPIRNSYLVYAQCNSIEELDRRPDRAEALLAYYKAVNPAIFKVDDLPLEILYGLPTLHVLFTREKILSEYDRKARQEIVSLMLKRWNSVRPFGAPEAIACIMYDDAYQPAVKLLKAKFAVNFEHYHASTEEANSLFSMAKKYISQ